MAGSRNDIRVCAVATTQWSGGSTNYLIQDVTSSAMVLVFIDQSTNDVYLTISYDFGKNWIDAVVVKTGTINNLSVWYEKWSNASGSNLIHMAYVETGVNDILYRNFNIDTEALGTETTVFAGTSAAGGGSISIWVSRHGEIRVAGSIDAGAEDGAWSSTDGGATWGDTIADPSEGATTDQYFGLPGWNSDTADEMIIFVDASANGLSVKRYDDSANTWAETAIITDGNFTDLVPNTNQYPNVACVVDLANSRNIVAAWTATDTANADLRLFFINDTTITESSANVVLNSADDQGLVAMALDTRTGYIYVIYVGKSDGSETFNSGNKLYYKMTKDDGATWSAETVITPFLRSVAWLTAAPRFNNGSFSVVYASLLPTTDFAIVNTNDAFIPAFVGHMIG